MTKARIYVRPAKGRVIDPATRKPLPEGGARVADSSYWRRRLRDGDVTLGGEARSTLSAKKASKAES